MTRDGGGITKRWGQHNKEMGGSMTKRWGQHDKEMGAT